MKIIDGGITAPMGYYATGAHIGIKKDKKDLAIINSEKAAVYGGTFTTNVVKAECVLWNMERFNKNDLIKGVVINSGNANACTGKQGKSDNELMAQAAAKGFNCKKENVLIASTGVIGVPLETSILEKGVYETTKAVGAAKADGTLAAEAIMTTDTFIKEVAIEIEVNGKIITMGGMAKGSGMIHPNMATMLGFVTTDVTIDKVLLQKIVKDIVDDTFNMISVDGDTSTNDMVTVLANGVGDVVISTEDNSYKAFTDGLKYIMTNLSKQVISDGEGVTKVVEVTVEGAKDKGDAKLLAKSIITSNLFKTAMFGSDANWGRILCAMGYSGAAFDHQTVSVKYVSSQGELPVLEVGTPVAFDEEYALKVLSEKNIDVKVNMKEGEGKATAWGCDLSYEYVRINGEYRS